MASFVSEELRTAMLTAYFKSGAAPTQLYLRLYNDTAGIVEASTLALMSGFEQNGGGYTAGGIVINPSDWTVSAGAGGIKVELVDKTWTTTADNWAGLRWAVLSTTGVGSPDINSGTILLAKDYGSGKTVTGIGANVTVDSLFYQIND